VEQVFNFVVLAGVGLCAWLALKPNYVFLIAIDRGTAHVSKGKVAREFVSEVNEVCGRGSIARGWIGGIGRGRRLRLAFSRSIPPACRQQLRNLWAMRR
jgi:Protein of unknown function (DUF3634)